MKFAASLGQTTGKLRSNLSLQHIEKIFVRLLYLLLVNVV